MGEGRQEQTAEKLWTLRISIFSAPSILPSSPDSQDNHIFGSTWECCHFKRRKGKHRERGDILKVPGKMTEAGPK